MSSILNDSASPALTAPLSDATLDSLQLHSQPFRAASDEDALYVDEATDAALGELREAILESDDLLLVVGPDGAGKTSLLQLLDRESDTHSGPSIQCFMVHGSERFNTQNLFSGMLEAFGREVPEELQDTLDELVHCVSDIDADKIVCAIVVDDAALIPDAELTRLLSAGMYINTSNRALLHTVLAADESFEVRIPDLLPGGADLPYAALQLAAMDDTRAADFLGFRLQEAGLPGELPFTLDEVVDLNAHAEGLPGAVQLAAARVLNEQHGPLPAAPAAQAAAAASPVRTRLDRSPKLLLGALAVALIAAGLFLFLPTPDQSAGDRYTVTETRKIDTSDQSAAASADDEDVNITTTAANNDAATDAQASSATEGALDPNSTSTDLAVAAGDALDAGSPDKQPPNAPEPGASLPGAPPAEAADTAVASAADTEGEPSDTGSADPPAAAADAAARQIVGIDFRRGAQGEGVVEVALSGAQGDVDTRQQGDQYIVAFSATGIADDLQGRRDVGDFDTPVEVVDIMSTGDRVLLIAQIGTDDYDDITSFHDNTLTIAFTPGTVGSDAENTSADSDVKNNITQNDVVTDAAPTDAVDPQAASGAAPEAVSQAAADTETANTDNGDSGSAAPAAASGEVDIAAVSNTPDAVEAASDSTGSDTDNETTTTLESPNWVLVQNPAQYTVQMIAARDPDSVDAFLQDHDLDGPNSVFSFELRGETWHAMVHGLFPSIESAQAAIQRLPAEAQVNQPWIRSISRLQSTLRGQEQ